MEARLFRPRVGVATLFVFVCTLLSTQANAQVGRPRQFTAQSQNFIVFASSPQWAAQVAETAERNRRQLAIHWLGSELPQWSERVPLHVQDAPNLGAGGETRFSLIGGRRVGNWMMSVQGSQERIIDSVLPHEITHTIFATHFAPLGKYVPRWADEGACTTVEHESEKRKHAHHLHLFLRTGRGLAFNKMFSLKEYPSDILPLYAQGHSAVQFLIDQGGPRKFVQFLESGMRTEAWPRSLSEFYGYSSIGEFQSNWNRWLADGSPKDLMAYAPGLRAAAPASDIGLVANTVPMTPSAAENPAAAHSKTADNNLIVARNANVSTALGNESWYKRRLLEVSGQEPTIAQKDSGPTIIAMASPPRDASNAAPAVSVGQPVPATQVRPIHGQATARPQPKQSPGVQVLDWGNSVPVPGIESQTVQSPTGQVPIYR